MMLDLLNNICIDIYSYQPCAGWDVCTNIPEEILDRTVSVEIDIPYRTQNGEWSTKTYSKGITATPILDEMINEIVRFARSLNVETGGYFEDHCFLEELMLNTDIRVITTSWGS
jgi:hypothetical protein